MKFYIVYILWWRLVIIVFHLNAILYVVFDQDYDDQIRNQPYIWLLHNSLEKAILVFKVWNKKKYENNKKKNAHLFLRLLDATTGRCRSSSGELTVKWQSDQGDKTKKKKRCGARVRIHHCRHSRLLFPTASAAICLPRALFTHRVTHFFSFRMMYLFTYLLLRIHSSSLIPLYLSETPLI